MTYSATEWDDWFVDGDESAVLVDGRVVVLSALATAVVGSAVRDLGLEDLTQEMVGRFGPPPGADAGTATLAVLDELVAAGILRAPG